MKARGLVWLGTRTRNFDETVRFFGDTLGLRSPTRNPTSRSSGYPTETRSRVFGPGEREHEHFDAGPVAGFLVDDVREARADLEAAGISFLGPVQESEDGAAWSHFRGPDGNVYEVTTPANQS